MKLFLSFVCIEMRCGVGSECIGKRVREELLSKLAKGGYEMGRQEGLGGMIFLYAERRDEEQEGNAVVE